MSASQRAWWIDELAYAGPEHLDDSYVSGYDRKVGDSADPEPHLATLRRYGLGSETTLIDLGAGTGRFALAAAEVCERVVAAEISEPMLARIRASAARLGRSNLEAVRAGFLTYEHTGRVADVVYTRHALHQLPDFWKVVALHRIAGMLPPGGVLLIRDLIYSFDPSELEERIDTWIAGAADSPVVGWTAEELAVHVRTEYSTFSWLLEPMLERAGFRIEEAEPSPYPATYGTYLCTRR